MMIDADMLTIICVILSGVATAGGVNWQIRNLSKEVARLSVASERHGQDIARLDGRMSERKEVFS